VIRVALKIFREGFSTYTAKQTYLLYVSQISVMLFGALTYYLLTKNLTRESFGDRELIIKVVTFLSSFFEFGVFTAGSRLLAIERDRNRERQIVSGLTFAGLFISLCFAAVLALMGIFIDILFKTSQDLSLIMAVFSLPLSLSLFSIFFQFIYQGTNEIIKLSFFNFALRFAHFILLALWICIADLTLVTSLVLYSLAVNGITLLLIWKASPSITAWKEYRAILINETKNYGFRVFIGRLIGMATYNLDSLMLAAYFSSTAVGNYAIAMFYVTPIAAFSEAFLSASFKRLSDEPKIPKKIYWINSLGLLGLITIYMIIGEFIFEILFQKYRESAGLIYPLAATMLIVGLTKPYNFFLSVKGEGKKLQNTAVALAIASIAFNIVLIPTFAETGAALASLASVLVSFVAHLIFYDSSVRENAS